MAERMVGVWCRRGWRAALLVAVSLLGGSLPASAAEPIVLSLEAGHAVEVPLRLGTAAAGPEPLEVRLYGDPGRGLELGFIDGSRDLVTTVAVLPGEAVVLRAMVSRCCSDDGEADVRIFRGGVQVTSTPVRVEVTPSLWACLRPWVRAAGVLALGALAWLYLRSMIAHSSFLDEDALESRLKPLKWTSDREPEVDRGVAGVVKDALRSALAPSRRLLAWLRANPLVFGLPGQRYEEALILSLGPRLKSTSFRLATERGLRSRLFSRPEGWPGVVLASAAADGLSIYGVPDRRGGFGQVAPWPLVRDGALGGDETVIPELVPLRNEKLVQPSERDERLDGQAAGWQVGVG